MALFKDAASGMFRARTQENIDTVREQLADAEARIGPLERHLSDVSLECALSGNFRPAEKIAAGLQSARDRVAMLRRALDAAEAAEAARLSEARAKEHRSRLRAGKAQLANLARAIEEYETSVGKAAGHWQRAVDAAEAFKALVGPGWSNVYPDLSPRRLVRLGELELARVGSVHTNTGFEPSMPGASAAGRPYPLVHQIVPISQTVRDLTARCGETLARDLAIAPPLPPAPPGVDQTWRGPAVGTEAWYQQREEHLRQAEMPEPAINEQTPVAEEAPAPVGDDDMKLTDAFRTLLRGAPTPEPEKPPLNPYPPGSVEWEGFEAVLRADVEQFGMAKPATAPTNSEGATVAEQALPASAPAV